MSTAIGLFSSDAQPLYKEDVFKLLCVPDGSTYQFRYEPKYVHDDLIHDLNSLKGRKCYVFFVAGNNIEIPEAKRHLEYYSVRSGAISEALRSPSTGLIHIYFKAGPFCDTTHGERPLGKWVANVRVSEGPNDKWIDRVRAVKDHFPQRLFYRFDLLTNRGRKITPIVSPETNRSIFELYEESEYQLDVSYFDQNNGESYVNFDTVGEVRINHQEHNGIGVTVDDRKYRLTTGSVTRSSEDGSIKFCASGEAGDEQRALVADVDILRKSHKPMLFGVLTSLSFLSLVSLQVFSKLLKDDAPVACKIGMALFSLVLIFISSTSLFKLFNKK